MENQGQPPSAGQKPSAAQVQELEDNVHALRKGCERLEDRLQGLDEWAYNELHRRLDELKDAVHGLEHSQPRVTAIEKKVDDLNKWPYDELFQRTQNLEDTVKRLDARVLQELPHHKRELRGMHSRMKSLQLTLEQSPGQTEIGELQSQVKRLQDGMLQQINRQGSRLQDLEQRQARAASSEQLLDLKQFFEQKLAEQEHGPSNSEELRHLRAGMEKTLGRLRVAQDSGALSAATESVYSWGGDEQTVSYSPQTSAVIWHEHALNEELPGVGDQPADTTLQCHLSDLDHKSDACSTPRSPIGFDTSEKDALVSSSSPETYSLHPQSTDQSKSRRNVSEGAFKDHGTLKSQIIPQDNDTVFALQQPQPASLERTSTRVRKKPPPPLDFSPQPRAGFWPQTTETEVAISSVSNGSASRECQDALHLRASIGTMTVVSPLPSALDSSGVSSSVHFYAQVPLTPLTPALIRTLFGTGLSMRCGLPAGPQIPVRLRLHTSKHSQGDTILMTVETPTKESLSPFASRASILPVLSSPGSTQSHRAWEFPAPGTMFWLTESAPSPSSSLSTSPIDIITPRGVIRLTALEDVETERLLRALQLCMQ